MSSTTPSATTDPVISNQGRSRGRTIVSALVLVIFSLLAGACGSSNGTETTESATTATEEFLVQALADGTGVSEETATCIIDKALETYTIEELASFGSSDPDPAVMQTVTEVTTNCVLSGNSVPTQVDDEPAPDVELVSVDETPVTDPTPETPTPETPTPETPAPQTPAPETPVANDNPLTTSTVEFCTASRQAYETFVVLDLLSDAAEPGAMQQILTELQVDIAKALVVAPNLELAKGPEVALDALGRIVEVARANNFSEQALTTITDASFEADVDTFASVMSALEEYLAGPCDYDEATARGIAAQRAEALELAHTAPENAATVYINDTTTGISVLVPADWSDTEIDVQQGGSSLLVAPDVEQYHATWHANGVIITAIDLADPSTAVDLQMVLSETAAWNNCSPSRNAVYDDGTYVGIVHVLTDCGGTDTGAFLIAGVNADNTSLLIVELQMVEADQPVIDMIIGSVDA